jgi:replication factor A1
MQLENIIDKIITQRKDITKKEIVDRIESKKKEAQGLLSDEGAARIIAQELFVKVNGKSFNQIKVKDLVTNLNDITLSARIISIWPIKEFNKSNGNIGKILRILLADSTGIIRCVLWNGKAEQLASEGDILGKIIRLSHAYTREDLTGAPEINCGDKCEITILPSEFGDNEFPELSTFFKNLNDLKINDTEVNIIATVNSKPEIINFKQDEEEGNVLRSSITNGTITMNLVSWNDKVDLLRGINPGDTLQIMRAQIREDPIKKPEIHIGKGSTVNILKNKTSKTNTKYNFSRIIELKSGTNPVILVRVINSGKIREFTRRDGSNSKYGSLLVGDNTGLIRLFLWDEKTDIMNKINQDDILLVENSQIKEKTGEIFISVSKPGVIKLNPEIPNIKPPSYPERISINDLNNLSRPIIIEGIVEESFLNDIHLSNGETVKVANVILNDDNSRANLSFWRTLANEAISLKSGMKIRVIGVQPKTKTSDQVSMSSNDLTSFIVIANNSIQPKKSGLISHYL